MTSEHDRSVPQNDKATVHPAATDLITLLVRTHLRHAQEAKQSERRDESQRPTPATNNQEIQPDA